MKTIHYNYKFEDAEFGTVYIRQNRNARNMIFRIVNGSVLITVPVGYNVTNTRPYFEKQKPELRKMQERAEVKKQEHFIDADFRINTPVFNFSIVCDRISAYQMLRTPCYQQVGEGSKRDLYETPEYLTSYSVELHCPHNTDFNDAQRQKWLEEVIVNEIQSFAKKYLLYQLFLMSQASGLNYEKDGVGHAQTRWGVCSTQPQLRKMSISAERSATTKVDIGPRTQEEYKSHKIMLSAYTVLLPEHLMKFVMLHELAHTRHPDHSPEFHATVNRLTTAILGLTEDECEQQMKAYSTNIFSFAE